MRSISTLVALTVGAAAMLATGAIAQDTGSSKGSISDLKVKAAPERFSVQSAPDFTQQAVACYTDPRGDTDPGAFARADITSFCGVHSGTEIGLSVQIAEATNPATDPNWSGLTGLLWDIYLDNQDRNSDFQVYVNEFGASVDYTDGPERCQAAMTFTGTGYDVKFPASCIDSAQSFYMDTYMAYDSNPADTDAPVYQDITNTVGPVVAEQAAPAPAPVVSPPPSGQQRATGRLAGSDRYSTAVAISQNVFGNGAPIVFIARADSFADALAGGTLSRGPILLVPQCGAVPATVLAEVRRLGATEVVALGGPGAVCDSVLQQVANA